MIIKELEREGKIESVIRTRVDPATLGLERYKMLKLKV